MKSSEKGTPYSDGYKAFHTGKMLNQNPYGSAFASDRGKAQR